MASKDKKITVTIKNGKKYFRKGGKYAGSAPADVTAGVPTTATGNAPHTFLQKNAPEASSVEMATKLFSQIFDDSLQLNTSIDKQDQSIKRWSDSANGIINAVRGKLSHGLSLASIVGMEPAVASSEVIDSMKELLGLLENPDARGEIIRKEIVTGVGPVSGGDVRLKSLPLIVAARINQKYPKVDPFDTRNLGSELNPMAVIIARRYTSLFGGAPIKDN